MPSTKPLLATVIAILSVSCSKPKLLYNLEAVGFDESYTIEQLNRGGLANTDSIRTTVMTGLSQSDCQNEKLNLQKRQTRSEYGSQRLQEFDAQLVKSITINSQKRNFERVKQLQDLHGLVTESTFFKVYRCEQAR